MDQSTTQLRCGLPRPFGYSMKWRMANIRMPAVLERSSSSHAAGTSTLTVCTLCKPASLEDPAGDSNDMPRGGGGQSRVSDPAELSPKASDDEVDVVTWHGRLHKTQQSDEHVGL